MELGQKVKCNGYLKKLPIKWVMPIEGLEKFISKYKPHYALEENVDYILMKEDYPEYTQPTKGFILKKFEGIIVAKKNVSTSNYYEYPSRGTYDPISLGYIPLDDDLTELQVTKDDYVKCYQVFYAMGKSRLVPTSECEALR